MDIGAFFQTYFVDPVIYPHTEIYNPYNTVAYALVLIVALFLTYKLLEKLNVKIDRNFFFANIPFIVLASTLRVLRDADIILSNMFVTPLIYFVIFGITVSVLIGSLAVSKFYPKLPYHYTMFTIGIILLVYFAKDLAVAEPFAFGAIFGLTVLATAIVYLPGKYFKLPYASPLNMAVIVSSFFDASSTVVGMTVYNYVEKHVIPIILIDFTNPWIMFPLKFAVVVLALWAIDNSDLDDNYKNLFKFAILCLTMGPGARNTLRIGMGV